MPYTFTTHNDNSIDVNGSSLKGYCSLHKSELIKLFGEPDVGCGGKVINEWYIEVTDENGDVGVITIYDWKNYDLGSLPDTFSDWHVGGHSKQTVRVLNEILEANGVTPCVVTS